MDIIIDIIDSHFDKVKFRKIEQMMPKLMKMSKAVNPYGDGKACNRIVRALKGEEVERYGK